MAINTNVNHLRKLSAKIVKEKHVVGSRLRWGLVVGPPNSVLLSWNHVQRATCSDIKFAWGISGWTPKFGFTFIKKCSQSQEWYHVCAED